MEEFNQNYKLIIESSKSYKETQIYNPEGINLENLYCPICFELYFNPVSESKNKHTFCLRCIKQHFNSIGIFCPLCKTQFLNEEAESCLIAVEAKIKEEFPEISSIRIKCPLWEKGCEYKTEYSFESYLSHLLNCDLYQAIARKLLSEIVVEMIEVINLEIDSHLKSSHSSIHSNFCQDWTWLGRESKDWKWWWWASNPWWTSSCEPCNVLWHKYEPLLDFKIEVMRKELIAVVKKEDDNII